MRMTATGVIMAQLGMLIPAESARCVSFFAVVVRELIQAPNQSEPRRLDHNANGSVRQYVLKREYLQSGIGRMVSVSLIQRTD